MKKLIALALCMVMTLTMAACGKEAPTEPTEEMPTENQVFTEPSQEDTVPSVYYLNYNPDLDAAWQQLADEYEAQTGVAVKVLTASMTAYGDILSGELEKDEAPTLFYAGDAKSLEGLSDYCLDLSGTDLYGLMKQEDLALTTAVPVPTMEGQTLVWTGNEGYWCVNAKASQLDIDSTLAFLNWVLASGADVLFAQS